MRSIAAIFSIGLAFAQQPRPEQSAVIRVTSKEVIVDVVVRDKKGRFLHNLKAAEFTVSDSGSPQKILSFRELAGGAASGETPPPTAPQQGADASRPIRLVSFVFERLAIDSRRLARKGALELLKSEIPANTYYGVFFIDQRLRVVQTFTNDKTLLNAAIDKATGVNPSDFASDNISLRQAAQQTGGSEGAAKATADSAGSSRGTAAVDSAGMANEAMNRMVESMLAFSTEMSREQEGRASLFSLWAILQEQGRLPGRKAVIYFSDGLQLPNSLWSVFQGMIGAANRANVTVYAVDARGLKLDSDQAAANAMLQSSARRAWRQATTVETVPVERGDVMIFDQAADAIRANVQAALGDLAESTGGALIANTNDIRSPLKRVIEELDSHYEISYQPPNESFDGRFHELDVKVNRAGAQVQARSGYYSLPEMEGQVVYPYEAPLLNAVSRAPLPKGVDYRVALVKFQSVAGGRQATLVFDLPLKDITFARDTDKKVYRTHVSVMALVKDAKGRVVAKLSRDVPVEEPLDKLAGFQQGHFIVTRALILEAGRYTVESAVADQEGKRIGAKRSAVVVLPAANGVALSDITMIRRFDKAPETPDAGDPYINGKSRIVPTLADAVPGGKGAMLSLYFGIYPDPGSEAPKLTIQFLQDGKVLAQGSPELPAADRNGVIPYIAHSPIENLKAGLYEVRVLVEQGKHSAEQSTLVTIE